MQNCSTSVIFIDSIILKRQKLSQSLRFYTFFCKYFPRAFLIFYFANVFLAKFPKINSLLLFLHFELDKKT